MLTLDAAAHSDGPPPTRLAPRPISASIERLVEKLVELPCRKATEQGVPCFPVATESEKPTVSVRDSLWDLGPNGKPSEHRPPSAEEMRPLRPGSKSVGIDLVSFDPICAAKRALKGVKGKNDAYYLYRVRDARGQRVILQDQRLNATSYQGSVELLGRFEGECEAVAAYRQEDRRSQPDGP